MKVNIFGGFVVSQRMLDLFKKPGDKDFSGPVGTATCTGCSQTLEQQSPACSRGQEFRKQALDSDLFPSTPGFVLVDSNVPSF